MRRLGLAILVVSSLVAARDGVAAEVRLVGMDRLYFEHVGEPGPPSLHADAVRAALPKQLKGGPAGDALRDDDGPEEEVAVSDFPVPGFGRDGTVVLRQVVDSSHRIHEVWWALYLNGVRQDVWYFEASPQRTEDKALANPSIESVRAGPGGEIAIDVLASMYRPQGALWISAWTLTFGAMPDALAYRRAEERQGLSRGYDVGGGVPARTFWTARRKGAVVEVTTADGASEAVLATCGAEAMEDVEVTGAELARVADCVTSRAQSRVSTRSSDAPAFIERGGVPSR